MRRARHLLVCLWMGLAVPLVHAQSWVPFSPAWGPFVQAADASALNRPLEASDAISVQGAQFKRVGRDLKFGSSDDTRVRFFGVNLTHDAAFPAPGQAREVARTLRSMGFNAVRLHHLDTLPSSDPAVFRSTLTEDPYPTLHAGAVARLKAFVDELKLQGIYVNLNLMVGYAFRPTVDGVPALDDHGTAPGYGSAVHVFHPTMVARQVEHARQLIGALGLKDNPVLAQVEIINESSLAGTWLHWDREAWTRQIRGAYAVELERQWQQWLKQRHGSQAAACKRWFGRACEANDPTLLTPDQAERFQLGASSGVLHKLSQKGQEWLAKRWSAQPNAAASPPDLKRIHPKLLDTLQFVTEVDRRFVETLRKVVQDATRATLPVTGTQVNFGAPLNFVSHAGMDYVDAHFYVDHPEFPGGQWSDTDWRIRNRSMSAGDLYTLLELATYRDPKRPFVVSEFNQPYPSEWGHEVLALTAAVATLQDWDGLYFFDYTLRHDGRVTPHNFNLQGDWPKLVTVGQAARLFRDGLTAPLTGVSGLPAPQEAIWFSAATDRRPDTWSRHVQHQLRIPLHAAARQRLGLEPAESSLTPPNSARPGPLAYNPADRLTTLVTPTQQFVMGQSAAKGAVAAGSLSIDSQQPDESLAVWLTSLDGLPVSDSKHMLLAVPAPVVGSQPGARPARPAQLVPYRQMTDWKTLEPQAGSSQPSGSRTAQGPLWLRRDVRQIQLIHKAPQLQVYPLNPNGSRREPLTADALSSREGRHLLRLNTTPAQTALWYELTAP